jgi:hypothetical protein
MEAFSDQLIRKSLLHIIHESQPPKQEQHQIIDIVLDELDPVQPSELLQKQVFQNENNFDENKNNNNRFNRNNNDSIHDSLSASSDIFDDLDDVVLVIDENDNSYYVSKRHTNRFGQEHHQQQHHHHHHHHPLQRQQKSSRPIHDTRMRQYTEQCTNQRNMW